MPAITFDTLRFSETLRDAGMPEAQAKALSHALQDQFISQLVTKQDLRSGLDELRVEFRSGIQSLRGELGPDIQSLRAELGSGIQSSRVESRSEIQLLRAEIHQIEPRLTIRLGGIVVVALGAFTALSKLIS